MLTDIMLGQYFPGTSPIHRLDPRTKIISTVFLITGIFLAQSYISYSVLVVFAVGIIISAGISSGLVLKAIRPLWIIVFFTLVAHIFFTAGGEEIYRAGWVKITDEGLKQGVFMSVRLLLLIVISSLLTFTTSPIDLTDGIEKLLNPFKRIGLPAHELAMMMTIALRFIPTLLEETDRIIKAQTARGADFSTGSIVKRAKNMVPILVPLFVSAFRRADELATAMEARCYQGGENRTRMKILRFSQLDWLAFAVTFILLGSLTLLRTGGY